MGLYFTGFLGRDDKKFEKWEARRVGYSFLFRESIRAFTLGD